MSLRLKTIAFKSNLFARCMLHLIAFLKKLIVVNGHASIVKIDPKYTNDPGVRRFYKFLEGKMPTPQ